LAGEENQKRRGDWKERKGVFPQLYSQEEKKGKGFNLRKRGEVASEKPRDRKRGSVSQFSSLRKGTSFLTRCPARGTKGEKSYHQHRNKKKGEEKNPHRKASKKEKIVADSYKKKRKDGDHHHPEQRKHPRQA